MSCVRHGRARAFAVLLLCSAALAACGPSTPPNVKSTQRGNTGDIGGVLEEKGFKEVEVETPAYPDDASLVEFLPRRNSDLRYYVDKQSVSLASDRVVRYTVVAKSPSGALTVDFEGMRCKTSEYKVYAYGLTPGKFTKSPDPQWRKVPRVSGDFRFALYKDYFCDLVAVNGRNAKDLVAVLQGNPLNNVTDKDR